MMNREKVIAWLSDTELYYREYGKTSDDLHQSEMAHDAIKLLKEQQGAIVPYIDIDEAKCPDCKVRLTRQELLGEDVLFEDFFDYCPHCGKAVNWK